ncbi:hypothetical protein SAMN05444003_2801 [Cognatiyoonia sediminum]|uniref:Cation/multidrug efflux pump n=1 Tax=Cognatiyoonia sediminum TaxID=1508389 RepID=A0A1M5S1G1_9RHOB|nr:hypothetical protein [Cognatiyoonia sediminum]SHH32168.1 hypothetical protein SAMN05444003_2801 [Cognatiyoonia sediminum]
MGFVRLVIFGFLLLSVIYLSLSWFTRSLRRESLENEWDEDQPEGISRDDYVAAGIKEYNDGLRPKLLLLVYVIPTVLIATIVYLTNSN